MFRDLVDDPDNYSIEPHLFLDVPYVPSEENIVEAVLELAGFGRRDVLYDLGSGDGRVVVATAMRHDARAIGIELDPMRIADAMEYAGAVGVEYMVDFIEDDIFTADISEATVVKIYLLDSINVQLRPRLLETLRPGTRIVSHAFNMGDWQEDARRRVSGSNLYLWIVPAAVAGEWEWQGPNGQAYRVELEQKYQRVKAHAWCNGTSMTVGSAVLKGEELVLELTPADDATPQVWTLTFADGELSSASLDAPAEPPLAV